VYEYDDPTLYQEMAEVLYAKGPSQDGPHPGRLYGRQTDARI